MAKKGAKRFLRALDNAILVMKKGHNIGKIGIVSAGDIDYKKGICVYSRNIMGWSGAPITEHVFTNLRFQPTSIMMRLEP
jgi:hypothetical protein